MTIEKSIASLIAKPTPIKVRDARRVMTAASPLNKDLLAVRNAIVKLKLGPAADQLMMDSVKNAMVRKNIDAEIKKTAKANDWDGSVVGLFNQMFSHTYDQLVEWKQVVKRINERMNLNSDYFGTLDWFVYGVATIETILRPKEFANWGKALVEMDAEYVKKSSNVDIQSVIDQSRAADEILKKYGGLPIGSFLADQKTVEAAKKKLQQALNSFGPIFDVPDSLVVAVSDLSENIDDLGFLIKNLDSYANQSGDDWLASYPDKSPKPDDVLETGAKLLARCFLTQM